MYQTSDIRNGLKVELDGYPYTVTYFQFVKPGKGTAFTRVKLKNLLTGNVIERTLRTGETLEPADIEEHKMQYLYNDGEQWFFMNQETFEQVGIPKEGLGDVAHWLLEEAMCDVMFYKGRPVSVVPPTFVVLEVTYTEPGARGNTATGTNKQAQLSTGASVGVPLFVETGELVKIDTRTGEYVERMGKK